MGMEPNEPKQSPYLSAKRTEPNEPELFDSPNRTRTEPNRTERSVSVV